MDATWSENWSDYNRWRGNCYEVAFKFLMAHEDEDASLRLCHGEPIGRGPIDGQQFGHAWVERGDGTVIDCTVKGGHRGISWQMFYLVGSLTPGGPRRYTAEEARVQALASKHYGPWPETQRRRRRRAA